MYKSWEWRLRDSRERQCMNPIPPISPQIKIKGLQGFIWQAWCLAPKLGGHHRLASDSCLENLKGRAGLASCPCGQGVGAVTVLVSLSTQSMWGRRMGGYFSWIRWEWGLPWSYLESCPREPPGGPCREGCWDTGGGGCHSEKRASPVSQALLNLPTGVSQEPTKRPRRESALQQVPKQWSPISVVLVNSGHSCFL